jgi:hypothetical protein
VSSETTDQESNMTCRPVQDVWFVRRAAIAFLAFLALANASTCIEFRYSRSAGAAILCVNIVVMLLGMAFVSKVKRNSSGAPLDSYMISIVVGPFIAWGLDVLIMQGGRFFYH